MDADVVCVAITGAAAIRPTLAAIDAGATVATATKEVLVMAGELVKARAAAAGARIIPIDSEHSALWQCLRGEDPASVSRLVLTASGGPFLRRPLDTFASITPAEALAHPTWNMGPKVTIDSATMMNKGLEVIEAHFLFDVRVRRRSTSRSIRPASCTAGSSSRMERWSRRWAFRTCACRSPWRLRTANASPASGRTSTFATPRRSNSCPWTAPASRPSALARSAGERGGLAPCVFNAANEEAVMAFTAGQCRFDEIVPAGE